MLKQKTIIRLTAIILFTYICAVTKAYADPIGGKAGAFLRLGLGADRVAMGDCGVALSDGANDWYYNPAALPNLEMQRASFGYRSMSLDRKIMYAGFAMPVDPNAGLSFGVMRAGTDDIDVRDSAGKHIYMLDHSENIVYGSFALQPHRLISAGIVIKWLINSAPDVLDDDKNLYAYGISVDLGIQITALPRLKFGFLVRDLGGSYNWDTSELWKDDQGVKEDNFPNLLKFGAAWDPVDNLTLTSDLPLDVDRTGSDSEDLEELHCGAEYRLEVNNKYGFRFRSGWNGDVMTFGIGLKMDLNWALARMDYAFYVEDIAPGSAHLIGWTFDF